jgi:hypothetical protein
LLSLPPRYFPIDRRFDDLRTFAAEADLRPKQNDTVHALFGLPERINYRRNPSAVPDIAALWERPRNVHVGPIAPGEREECCATDCDRFQNSNPECAIEGAILDRFADVLGRDVALAVEIGDRARDLQDPIVGTGA